MLNDEEALQTLREIAASTDAQVISFARLFEKNREGAKSRYEEARHHFEMTDLLAKGFQAELERRGLPAANKDQPS
jgi:hypothetical protein